MTRPSFQSRTLPDPPDLDAMLTDLSERVESDVRAGRRPPLTDYAAGAPAVHRRRVFHELLVVEIQARRRAGEDVTVETLLLQYPGQRADVEAAHRSACGTAGWPGTGRRDLRAGDVVGRYRLVRLVGHGGMGLVFLGAEVTTGQRVALKFLPPELLGASPELAAQARQMFAREAEAAQKIEHPNVVRVLDRGDEDSFAYLVMEFINGPTLRDQLRRTGPLPPRDAAEIVEAVARGLQAAHGLGILHRDIKPANVLLELRMPESVARSDDPTAIVPTLVLDGRSDAFPRTQQSVLEVVVPKLADFGLAKQLDATRSEATLTVSGMGTLAYSAPEQAGGDHHTGRRADVYSLGATLYECLTGRPPFHAADAKETLRQVLTEDAAPPRQLNPQVPGDLDRVCLKCLRKESRKRYAAAGDLADDLRRFLDGKPVRARYESFRERAVKWVRRHPARAAALAVGLIAAFALLGVWRGLEHQREEDRIARRVDELVSTEPARVPDLVDELVRSGGRANRNVRERWDQAVASAAERTRLAMALVRFDAAGADTPAARLLEDRLPTADPAELKLIREALQPRAAELRPRLVAGLEHSDPDRRLRYAAALAGYEPDAAELAAHWTGLAERLVAESPLDLPAWVSVFRPAAGQLRPPLEKLFKSPGREDEARAAAAVLVAFLERPADLLDLIELDADEVQFRYVAAKLLKRSEETRSELATRLTGKWEAPTESERDKKARVQAHYAALALRLDPDGPAWEHLLRPPARDFRLQSYLIHWLPSRGVPAGSVLRRCDGTVGLAALLLTLGSYNQQQLPPSLRAELMPRVIEYFCKDPDPGVHSAAEWLLRKWGYGTEVDQAKVAFADKPMPQERRWYVTPDGMTMAVFPDVVNHQADFFELGDDGKQEHVTRKVTLSPFAISVLKVERAKVIERLTGRAPGPPPWPGLSHSKAAQYCNALTVDEMGEDECCYEKRGGWWRLRPDYAKRAGYRLPTEFEWDYAVRFGTTTPRFYGNDPELFEEYGGLVDPRRRTAVSGSVYKPNWAGLFDSLVPPFEYCHRRLEFKGDSDQESIHGVAGLLEKQELWRSDTAHTWHAFNDSTAFTFRIVQSWPPKR